MSDKVFSVGTMLHSQDKQKNFKYESENYFTGKFHYGFVTAKFYTIDDLVKNGFIHLDGSLQFEFYIKKNNF